MNLQLEAEPGISVSNGSLHEQHACNETPSQRGSALRNCIPDLPEFWVEVCSDAAEFQPFLGDWDWLAKNTNEPNCFYDPAIFLPGMETFRQDKDWRIVFVYRQNKRVTDPPVLCGVFPLEAERSNLPGLSQLKLITHVYSYLSTPLLHSHYAQEAVSALMHWARANGYGLLNFSLVHGDGLFYRTLIDVLNTKQISPFIVSQYSRALLIRKSDYESYQSRNLRGHSRRDINRQRRRLEELGQFEFRQLRAGEPIAPWIDSFLKLEAEGWKGAEGTAILAFVEHSRYFRQVLERTWQTNQLQMHGIFLDGKPIALKCNLVSAPGAFAWKIAYHEGFAKYSPGVQLEQENIRLFQAETELEWMDSCAVASHSMINRLWCDRRSIKHILVPTGGLLAEGYTSCRPLLRWTRKLLRNLCGLVKRKTVSR